MHLYLLFYILEGLIEFTSITSQDQPALLEMATELSKEEEKGIVSLLVNIYVFNVLVYNQNITYYC